ncbi:MAG: class I SAM-dependent methyltransferase [Solirubrobacterales bacterium]
MTVRAWDGGVYDRISGPMEAMGRAVLDRLELAGDETVIDAGCGSGRVTEALIERLPRGRVIAVDASPSMVQAARERIERSGIGPERVEVREADLLELEVREPVDAILSTATFHWIPDHERLFRRLHAVLRPGGRLVAQCGGEGNIDVLRGVANAILAREPYAEHFRDWRAPWNYAGPESTRERLLRAGFASAECWLQPAPQQPEHPREFLSSIVLGPHHQRLPEELREPFMDTVLAELGKPVVVDYIRLNIDAVA